MQTTSHNFFLTAAVSIASLVPTWVQGAELGDFYNLGQRPKETAIRAGAVVISARNYDGSSDQKVSVLPGIFLQTTNGIFADPLNGIGYSFEPQDNLQYGVRLNVETGRAIEDALPGFEKIKMRLNPGAYANYVVNDSLTLRSALRLGVGDGADGSVLHLGGTYKVFQAGFFSVNINAALKFADPNYMQSYFGVSPTQAAASGLKAYKAGAGFASTKLGITAATPLSREVFVFANVSMQRLHGDAANSPIVVKKTLPSVFFGGVYTF